jgi:hypothetical protein
MKQITNHTEHLIVDTIMLDAQNSTALQSSVLYPEYIGYWSQAKDAPLYQGKPLKISHANLSITIFK